jgi:hypothetical protein
VNYYTAYERHVLRENNRIQSAANSINKKTTLHTRTLSHMSPEMVEHRAGTSCHNNFVNFVCAHAARKLKRRHPSKAKSKSHKREAKQETNKSTHKQNNNKKPKK